MLETKYKDFFNHNDVQLPLVREEGDFQSFLEVKFDRYKTVLQDLGIENQHLSLCNDILAAVDIYLSGTPDLAYKSFDNCMTEIADLLGKIPYETKEGNSDNVRLYRMRYGYGDVKSRKDIFHIPFDKRHLISTQRYSIPGFPCLYLSGSLYTCWDELSRPNWNDTSVSAFRVASGWEIKFIDLAFYDPRNFQRYMKPGKGETQIRNQFLDMASHAINVWPLLAACCIKCKYPEGKFKHEYIVPQLLLQWVTRNSNFDGIKYLSTHINNIATNYHYNCNFVIPVKTIQKAGVCHDLRERFILTQPCHWQMLKASQKLAYGEFYDNFEIELIPSVRENYNQTEFGEIQAKLNFQMTEILEQRKQGNTDFGKVEL